MVIGSAWINRMRSTFVHCTLLWIAAATAATYASADDRTEERIRAGVELRRVGNDEAALPHFQEAYRLDRTAKTAGQLGLCEQALGRWVDAEDHLMEAFQQRQDPWVKKNNQILREQLQGVKAHIGRVEVKGEPSGASVSVQGRSIGNLPLQKPVRVNEGRVDVEVRASGYAPMVRTLEVGGGQHQTIVLNLVSTATSPDPVPVSRLSPQPASDNEAQAALTTQAIDSDQGTAFYKQGWFWGVVGAAIVAGAATAFLLANGSDEGPNSAHRIEF